MLVVWPEVTSKRTCANACLPGLLLPVPLSPHQATADPCLHSRPPNTHRQVWLSLLWDHCSFPWVLLCTGFVCALQESVSPVLWQSYTQIPLSFKVRFPGDSQSLPNPQVGKSDVGPRTFTTVGELLWYYGSPVYGSPTWQVWDLILM